MVCGNHGRIVLGLGVPLCDETYSCGTGVTAAALVCFHNENGFNEVEVKTIGGPLSVEFDRVDDNQYSNIWLCGPAEKVFEGQVDIK